MANKKKYRDMNGFLHLEGTPISRVQVAPYRGNQIDSKGKMDIDPKLKPDELYGVFRPPEELFDEETMKSFDGMPFRVGHQMLGKKDSGANAMLKGVDSNPVDGCIFNVRRDEDRPDYLIADIVIYTEKALRAIANGTKELSLGYRCFYVPVDSYPEPEYYQGQPYFFRQQGITANHLALVPHGRAGSSVCVQDEAPVTVDGLVITCDSLPEEIQLMEDNEKKAKDKLRELLNGSEEAIQDCLDYCDLTKEQKEKIKEFKKDGTTDVEVKKEEAVAATDACPHCEGKKESTKDAEPPVPPPAKEGVKPVEEVDPKKEKKEEAPAAPAPAAPAPAPAAPAEGAPAPAAPEKKEEAAPATPATDSAPEKKETQDCGGKTYTQDEFDEGCKKAKEAGVAEFKETLKDKIYTQDECDEACKKAKEEGRKEGRIAGIRAVRLADAVGEDAADKSEGDIARAACKKIKGLEFAADAADDVAIAAVKAHLASKTGKEPEGEEKKEAKPAPKKTLLSVDTQDEAIAKTHGSFNTGRFQQFLASN